MKNEIRIYLIWTLLLTNLLYDEYWGLNALIVAVVTVGLLAYRNFRATKNLNLTDQPGNDAFWFFGASIWLISATAVFLVGGWFQVFMYLISMTYFGSLQDRKAVSIPFSPVQAVISFSTGLGRIFHDTITRFQGDNGSRSKKIARQIILFSIGLIICISFLKLYQLADADFYALTSFINLDWISWGFIFFYILLTWILYGFYYYQSEPEVTKFDQSFKNDISTTYTDSLERFFGVKQERLLALFTLGILNVMLVLLLVLDVRFLVDGFGVDKPVAEYSSLVHQGINALIFSLVLVILLISFFFRGSLNFENHKALKYVGVIWLSLNCILVITTGIKNYDYIAEFGFTYKRLGVLLYLFLCGIGLVFSVYKILRVQSVWFLIRNTSLSFILVFAIVSMFNWNQIIADYNIQHVKKERLDLEYLFELGPDAYPALMNFHVENQETHTDLFYRLVNAIESKLYFMEFERNAVSWRSYTVRDERLYQKLSRYHFQHEGDQTRQFSVRN
jgi:hypothetical protein